MPDLLIELFSEEIPARMQQKAAGDLRSLVTNALVEAGLTYEGAKEYWTPRRLALDIRGLSARSADVREERKGPRTDAPQKAIEGFMRGAGLESIEKAEIRTDPKKGDFYVAVIEKPGREAPAIIADAMPAIIRDFPWPKSMRWGETSASSGSLKWVRPLQSILCTFGPETEDTEVVEFEAGGVNSGNTTRGHRFLSPEAFEVVRFDDYASKLEAANVMLDAERRRETILTDARNLAFAQGYELVEDDALAAETANLVEWPVVLMGEFEEEFLEIPGEVVRLTIRENQKCFVLRPQGGDALVNRFIMVSNIVASDGGSEIARGNAKVVRARLSDAKFFWETDLQVARSEGGFDRWVEGLASVTFHAKLGSQGDRIERIMALAKELAPVVGAKPEQAERAAYLAKADLQSQIVYEFPEMQGAIGRRYAQEAGEADSVALAIEEHYKPLGPSDDVPSDPVSVSVGLADKLDMLVGFWAIDEKPTGSKDPYALRRAALGVIRLVLENKVRPSLSKNWHQAWLRVLYQQLGGSFKGVIEAAYRLDQRLSASTVDRILEDISLELRAEIETDALQWVEKLEKDEADLLSFFHDRLKVYLRDRGVRHDLIDAVVTPTSDDLLIVAEKAQALQKLIESEDGVNLLAGYKRAANILAAEEKKGTAIGETVKDTLFETDEERALFETLGDVELLVKNAVEAEDFEGAMTRLATLRAPIDNFFEHVLVNADDAIVRANRLALLARIRTATGEVADFSKISG